MAKLAPDWESIEQEYRTGIFSVRELGKRHDTAESTIRVYAKKRGWQRDLMQRVKREVRAKLVRTSETGEPIAATDEEIVDAAAATLVEVIKVHRRDIAQGRSIVEKLFGQLTDAADKRDEIADTVVDETKEDKTAERRNRMLRAISLPVHAAAVRDLSQALRNVVGLEREAFNLDDQPVDNPETASQLTAKVANKILANLNALTAG